MICKKCDSTGILCHILDKHYYYCRTCKVEIELELAPKVELPVKQITFTQEKGLAHCDDPQCAWCNIDTILKGIP